MISSLLMQTYHPSIISKLKPQFPFGTQRWFLCYATAFYLFVFNYLIIIVLIVGIGKYVL